MWKLLYKGFYHRTIHRATQQQVISLKRRIKGLKQIIKTEREESCQVHWKWQDDWYHHNRAIWCVLWSTDTVFVKTILHLSQIKLKFTFWFCDHDKLFPSLFSKKKRAFFRIGVLHTLFYWIRLRWSRLLFADVIYTLGWRDDKRNVLGRQSH